MLDYLHVSQAMGACGAACTAPTRDRHGPGRLDDHVDPRCGPACPATPAHSCRLRHRLGLRHQEPWRSAKPLCCALHRARVAARAWAKHKQHLRLGINGAPDAEVARVVGQNDDAAVAVEEGVYGGTWERSQQRHEIAGLREVPAQRSARTSRRTAVGSWRVRWHASSCARAGTGPPAPTTPRPPRVAPPPARTER